MLRADEEKNTWRRRGIARRRKASIIADGRSSHPVQHGTGRSRHVDTFLMEHTMNTYEIDAT